uniref:C4b-binding protein alpha chain-like isoform X4 n=1 Tax=Podarcis muralis TaxID=64176 RepID=UPI0010A05B58|nr:C4b-binding protein alpha chain-like isoform X4 [Podarcis muralis]
MQRPSWGLLRALWLTGISILLLPQWSLPQDGVRFFCRTPPNISNGSHNGTGASFYALGTVITYTCHDNFSLIGAHSISCGMDGDTKGVWKGKLPKCKVDPGLCGAPLIPSGTVRPLRHQYKIGTSVVVACNKQYSFPDETMEMNVACQGYNSWYPPVQACFFRTSPDIYYLSIRNARIIRGKKTSYEPGDTVTIRCSAGYTLAGPSEIRYIGGKQWSPKLPSCYLSFVFVLLIAACLLIFLWLPAQSVYTALCSG